MSHVNVTARKWSGGWELELDSDNITQVRALANAKQQVKDYLDTIDPDTPHEDWSINIIPEIGALADEVREAKEETAQAAQLQQHAARRTRQVVRELREQAFSVSDIAAVLNISRGRVSQLQHSVTGNEEAQEG